MPSMTLRPLVPAEAADAALREAVAMGRHDEEAVDRWRERIRRGVVWGLEDGGTLLGHCSLLPSEHWFGGRRVPCMDVASVAVAPEHRGRGVARQMMVAAVELGTAEGYGLSLLFPATTAMYRKFGWELAGTWRRYRVPARAVPSDGPVMRVGERSSDLPAIRECFAQAQAHLSGPAARTESDWERLLGSPYLYVLDAADEPGDIEAYMLVSQRQRPDDWRHVVVLDDWAATTTRGLRSVAAMVGRWRTFGSTAEFVDTVPSRWSGIVPEQDIEQAGGMHWMARPLDLPAAIQARGFPQAGGSVVLAVTDDVGPSKTWTLEVARGRGLLSETHAPADVHLDVRAIGPLFTGFRSARELRLLGFAHGSDSALAVLEQMFAGPPPVVFDFF